MTTKIFLFITLLAYSIIVSQSFMYLLALKNVQLQMDALQYTNFRQLIDEQMRSNFKYVLYAAVLTNAVLVIFSAKNPNNPLFIFSTIALLALIADILLTIKGNLPVNDIINNWSPSNIPSNWMEYRAKWLSIFQWRQLCNIIGFAGLLAATVFRK